MSLRNRMKNVWGTTTPNEPILDQLKYSWPQKHEWEQPNPEKPPSQARSAKPQLTLRFINNKNAFSERNIFIRTSHLQLLSCFRSTSRLRVSRLMAFKTYWVFPINIFTLCYTTHFGICSLMSWCLSWNFQFDILNHCSPCLWSSGLSRTSRVRIM